MTEVDNAATVAVMWDAEELRELIALTSVEDTDAVRDLYLAARECYHQGDAESYETLRRAERRMGQAIRSGQARGVIARQGEREVDGAVPVLRWIPAGGQGTRCYSMFDNISDALFEATLAHIRLNGDKASHPLVMKVAQQLRDKGFAEPTEPVRPARKVKPTARGRRTVEHMAIQLNAIAMGVADLDPAEVDYGQCEEMLYQASMDMEAIKTFVGKVKQNAQ